MLSDAPYFFHAFMGLRSFIGLASPGQIQDQSLAVTRSRPLRADTSGLDRGTRL